MMQHTDPNKSNRGAPSLFPPTGKTSRGSVSCNQVTKLVWGFLCLLACASIVANVAKWLLDYVLPMFNKPHFFADYGLFRGLGERAILQPFDLYGSESDGSWVVALGKMIFHMYSPVAALFFIPLALMPDAIGYAVMSSLTWPVGLLACWLYCKALPMAAETRAKSIVIWSGLLLAMGCSPVFEDMFLGNVSAWTLLHCVLFFILLEQKHPVWAGAVLAFGFWLKLYPVFLAGLLWGRKDCWKCAASFALCAVALFAISLVRIPFSQHARFFFEILPAYSKQTTLHAMNQSIHAVAMRAMMGGETYHSWNNVLMPLWVRCSVWIVGAMWVVMAILLSQRTARRAVPGAAAVLTGVVSLISPVGWGYTYALLLPAFLFCWADAQCGRHPWRWIVPILAFGALLVPSWWVPDSFVHHPMWSLVLLNRYAWAGMALMAQTIVVAWKDD